MSRRPRTTLDIPQTPLKPEDKFCYGDNLEKLAMLSSESVDLVYPDPPISSARNYTVTFFAHLVQKSSGRAPGLKPKNSAIAIASGKLAARPQC